MAINSSQHSVTNVTVSCLGSERLVGGGAQIMGNNIRAALSQSYPQSVGAGGTWAAQAITYAGGGSGDTLVVWAICESP